MKRVIKAMIEWFLFILIVGIGLCYIVFLTVRFYNSRLTIGVSFDPDYARYLHLDVSKTFNTILNDWRFRHLRLSAHWSDVESEQGTFNFQDLDNLMNEADKAHAKVILAVGQKTPRWPECHVPEWAKKLNPTDYQLARENYIQAVVEHFRNHPALEMWQVENEPFLPFGECPSFSQADLLKELTLVKQLDASHPRLVTDSGELSTWRKTATVAEFFGTTMYRVVWNKYIGYFSYDWLPATFYRLKLWLVGRDPASAFVSELQAEPWIPDKQLKKMPFTEQDKSMNLDRLKKNIDYAHRVGLPRAYLWGAEWWMWLKEHGITDVNDYIAALPKGE